MFAFLDRCRASTHRFCEHNLSAYIDGQLSPRDEERVRRHLDECQACRWEFESLQRTVALLRRMPPARAPRSFRIPQSAPAPSLPAWMRPGAYAALRTATVAAAALLVVTIAGNAIALPMHTASAPQPVSLINGYGTDETVAPRQPLAAAAAPESATGAAGPEGVGIAALATPTPEAQGMLGAGPMPEPSPQPSEWGRGAGPAVVEQPTLTAEEATRMALAPPGKGGGVETDAPEPAGTPDGAGPVAALEATGVPEEPAAAAARAAVPQPAGSQPETAEDRVAAGTLEAPPAGRDRWRAARFELARYPWRPLAVAMAAVLAALLAATLWLRHRRAHWP